MKKTPEMRAESLRIAKERLDRPDEGAVRQALASLTELGGADATQAIVARMRRGLPPQLVEAAVDSLVLLGQASAAPALLELMQHSRAPIRKRAAEALGALGVRSAQSALLYALDDPSPEVRVAAVSALGNVGDARALPALYAACDRGERSALTSIGKLAGNNDLKLLLARAPDGEVAGIAPALDTMMQRPKLALETKLRLVRELDKLGTPSARTLLVQWLDAFKTAGPAPLRKALFDAIKRLDGLAQDKQKHVVETTGAKT